MVTQTMENKSMHKGKAMDAPTLTCCHLSLEMERKTADAPGDLRGHGVWHLPRCRSLGETSLRTPSCRGCVHDQICRGEGRPDPPLLPLPPHYPQAPLAPDLREEEVRFPSFAMPCMHQETCSSFRRRGSVAGRAEKDRALSSILAGASPPTAVLPVPGAREALAYHPGTSFPRPS